MEKNNEKAINRDIYFTYIDQVYDKICVDIMIIQCINITLITSKNVIFVVDGQL
jgi:hypothetical protein